MITSFRHGFVFIKSKKTGGSAVERVLAPMCGPEDIVTPNGLEEGVEPGGEARNFTRNEAVKELYRAGLQRGQDPGFESFIQIDQRCREAGEFYAHMPAAEVRERIGPQVWDQAYKFSIERHPYEKAVSQAWFSWARQGRPEQDFAAFFDREVRSGPYLNARFYCIDGLPALDQVIRYERLEEELAQLLERFGLKLPAALPRIKAEFRTDRRPAREVLTGAQKEAIYRRCRAEFEFMGYEP